MSNKFNIAVAGATGNVGREIIQILEDKNFPVDQLFLLACPYLSEKFPHL